MPFSALESQHHDPNLLGLKPFSHQVGSFALIVEMTK